MKSLLVRTALLLALSLPLAAPAAQPAAKAPAKAAPARSKWLATSHRTAEGAIVIGNPAAKVKLVEYLSLTCPHCAVLSGEAMPPLRRDYIALGLVSLEVRHAVRDGYDFVASLLLRCEPPGQYLSAIEGLFATQEEWMTKGASAKTIDGFATKPVDEQLALVAKSAGFDSFFAKRGMSAPAYAACMADTKAKDVLTQMAGNSWQRDKIPGTPLMMINGVRQENVMHWTDLEPRIKAALK
ncbi:MAG: protein-disulfide isomerase [Sphingomonadales bacterium]|nr:MAG: protein-disulfide isomerase [Sphingomonadales bacterium]